MHPTALGAGGLALLAMACAPTEEGPSYRTERFDVFAEFEVCEGTLETIERAAARAEAAHGAGVRDVRVAMHLGEAAVESLCADVQTEAGVGGCAFGIREDAGAAAGLRAAAHEAVHLVRRRDDVRSVRFVEEGLAEFLSGGPGDLYGVGLDAEEWSVSFADAFAPDSSLELGELYFVAPHFLAWLTREYVDAIGYVAGPDPVLGLEQVTEQGLADLEAAWRAGSQFDYWQGSLCDDARAPTLTFSPGLTYERTVSCRDRLAYGFLDGETGMRHRFCTTLPEDGTYLVENRSSDATLTLLRDPSMPCGSIESDLIDREELAPGDVAELSMAGCSWIGVFEAQLDAYDAGIRVDGPL